MSDTATYTTGAKDKLKLGSVLYKLRDGSGMTVNTTPRLFNIRGSGDAAGLSQVSGMADEAGLEATIISTDDAILALLGTTMIGYWMRDSTTILSANGKLIAAVPSPQPDDVLTWQLTFQFSEIPSQASGITY